MSDRSLGDAGAARPAKSVTGGQPGSVAVVFPGQGAQAPGMGLELARAYPSTAGAVFRVADRVLGFRLSRLIETGDPRLLACTEITQPALVAASVACWYALRAELPGLAPSFAAGLSLGEYSALTAAEALDLESAFRLIACRGRFTEAVARAHEGGMSAVLGLERTAVEAICVEASSNGSGRVWVANYNAPGQNVIAGDRAALEDASGRSVSAGGKVRPLKVGGAFHCPLMAEAGRQLSPLLASTPWRNPRIPVYSNATARPYESAAELAQGLETQVASPVLWEDIVRDMGARGVRVFVELGPGRTLASLISRILPGAAVLGVSDLASLAETVAALGTYALEVVS